MTLRDLQSLTYILTMPFLALIKISQTTGNEHYNVCPDDQINIADVADAVMIGTDIHKPLNWLGEGANWKGDNRIITVSNNSLDP